MAEIIDMARTAPKPAPLERGPQVEPNDLVWFPVFANTRVAIRYAIDRATWERIMQDSNQ